MHHPISPAILYWGTPIVLITTENEDGTPNICPMSSAFWLGHRCMLGLASTSQTTANLLRTRHCVLNLPSDDMAAPVNALARTTGRDPPPPWKRHAGYVHVKDKFAHARLAPLASHLVAPPRIRECPVHMEAELVVAHDVMADTPDRGGAVVAVELRVLRVHVEDRLRLAGHANRVDADKWRPMLMCFQEYYGMGQKKLAASRLASIDEEHYRRLAEIEVVDQGSGMDPEKLGTPINGHVLEN